MTDTKTNEETIQLLLNRNQAAALYAALGALVDHDRLREPARKQLESVKQMLLAVNADRGYRVFEYSPYTLPREVETLALTEPLGDPPVIVDTPSEDLLL